MHELGGGGGGWFPFQVVWSFFVHSVRGDRVWGIIHTATTATCLLAWLEVVDLAGEKISHSKYVLHVMWIMAQRTSWLCQATRYKLMSHF